MGSSGKERMAGVGPGLVFGGIGRPSGPSGGLAAAIAAGVPGVASSTVNGVSRDERRPHALKEKQKASTAKIAANLFMTLSSTLPHCACARGKLVEKPCPRLIRKSKTGSFIWPRFY
jgi:hypothetical protein